jgi:hypothetical protein
MTVIPHPIPVPFHPDTTKHRSLPWMSSHHPPKKYQDAGDISMFAEQRGCCLASEKEVVLVRGRDLVLASASAR